MSTKSYDWVEGATLDSHSRRKHKILREYFAQYLSIRCQFPKQSRFRLAVVDGFSGGGRYKCGSPGSPLVFIEEVIEAVKSINIGRAAQGILPVEIDCLFIFNDNDRDAIEALKSNVAPLYEASHAIPTLRLHIEFRSQPFESVYPNIKTLLAAGNYKNVIFNLDQYGHSHVRIDTITDIMRSFRSAEIFYTFAIQSLIAFLEKNNPNRLMAQFSKLGLNGDAANALEKVMNRKVWLGAAERLVFDEFKKCAPYVSPFSINNPDGWRYWLIHFGNYYRARQVYNDVLHANSGEQAHFGRAGLNMLSYDPVDDDVALYLFDSTARNSAKEQLLGDIPEVINKAGGAMKMLSFYESVYNTTPAHADDVHQAVIENPDLIVLTPRGGERRRPNTIDVRDLIKLKPQKSFHLLLFGDGLRSKIKRAVANGVTASRSGKHKDISIK